MDNRVINFFNIFVDTVKNQGIETFLFVLLTVFSVYIVVWVIKYSYAKILRSSKMINPTYGRIFSDASTRTPKTMTLDIDNLDAVTYRVKPFIPFKKYDN